MVPHDAVWGDARIAASDVSNAKANAKQTLAMVRRTRRRSSGEPEAGLAAPVQPANAPSDGVVWSTRPRKTPSALFLPGSPLVPKGGGGVTGWSRSPVPSEKHLGQAWISIESSGLGGQFVGGLF